MLLQFAEIFSSLLNLDEKFSGFYQNAVFKPWRLITGTAAIPDDSQAVPRVPGYSGRAAVPQITHTPLLVRYFSFQL